MKRKLYELITAIDNDIRENPGTTLTKTQRRTGASFENTRFILDALVDSGRVRRKYTATHYNDMAESYYSKVKQ